MSVCRVYNEADLGVHSSKVLEASVGVQTDVDIRIAKCRKGKDGLGGGLLFG